MSRSSEPRTSTTQIKGADCAQSDAAMNDPLGDPGKDQDDKDWNDMDIDTDLKSYLSDDVDERDPISLAYAQTSQGSSHALPPAHIDSAILTQARLQAEKNQAQTSGRLSSRVFSSLLPAWLNLSGSRSLAAAFSVAVVAGLMTFWQLNDQTPGVSPDSMGQHTIATRDGQRSIATGLDNTGSDNTGSDKIVQALLPEDETFRAPASISSGGASQEVSLTEGSTERSTGSSNSSLAQPALMHTANVEDYLRSIYQLREAGHDERADAILRELRVLYPDAQIPSRAMKNTH